MDEIKYRTCRTCLKKSTKLLPLVQLAKNSCTPQKTYGQLLKEYVQFEEFSSALSSEQESKMPLSMCTICCRQLTRISQFISQAQSSNNKLKIMVTNLQTDCLREEAIDLPMECENVFDIKHEYDRASVGDASSDVLSETSMFKNDSIDDINEHVEIDDATIEPEPDEKCAANMLDSKISTNSMENPSTIYVPCPICLKSLKRVYLLKHLRKVHEINNPSNFWKKQQLSLMTNDMDFKKIFKCTQCDYISKSKAGINYHNRTKHTTEEDKFKCKFCMFTSLKKLELLNHIKIEHKAKFKALKRNLGKKQINGDKDNDTEAGDDSCSDEAALNELIPADTSDDDDEFLNDMISADRRTLKARYVDGKPLNSLARKCDECNKVYKDFPSLYVHKRFVHISDDMYSICIYCGKKYKRSKDLRNHMSQIHSAEIQKDSTQTPEVRAKRFTCSECDYATRTSTHLKLHIRRHHTGEKPFVCEICGNSFLTSYDLKKHSYLHTGEKPYKCPMCPKTFRVSSKLTKHKRVHTGERPFKCPECGKGFTQEYNLSVHKRTHMKEQKINLPVQW